MGREYTHIQWSHPQTACHLYFACPIIAPVMPALTDISLRRGRKVLLESVSFQIHAGQRMGVIGANGSGKSTLFAMLLGELEPDDGELALDPKNVIAHVG